MSLEWLDGLPSHLRPINLTEQYPRIVNLIAVVWNNPAIVGALVTGLLTYDSGGEDGFPAAVLLELRALHKHHFKADLAQQAIFREFEAIAAGESWDRDPANTCETRPAADRIVQRDVTRYGTGAPNLARPARLASSPARAI